MSEFDKFPNKPRLSSIRVQKLLEGEKSHFEKEIEHERVVNQQCNSGEEDSATVAYPQEIESPTSKVFLHEEEVQLPSRAISISVFYNELNKECTFI